MASITLKQGDTTPEFTATLSNPAQELTGNETIRFYMEAPAQGEQQHGDLIVNAEIPNSQVDYQTNEVTYDFSVGETSRLDDNLAEVVVTYPDGEVQTFPDSGYHTITVEKPVNRDAPPADLSSPDISVGVVDASQVNAPTLQAVETVTGSVTGGKTLSNIAGANLDIDANGNLNAVSGQDSPSHYNPIYDSDEDGIIDADVNNDVTTTGELYGTEQGINLANPLHRVYSDSSYFHTFFQSIDTWQQTTSGSGSIVASQYYLKLMSGTTSGSSASVYRTVNNDINSNFGTVDSERVFRIEANFRYGPDARTTYITNGKLQSGEAGFGIKAANGTIMGVLHDGTSESTVDLATPTAGEHYGADLMCRYDPNGVVEFFIDKTKQGELTHSLGNFDGRTINFYTENTSAVDRELWFSEFRMGMAP